MQKIRACLQRTPNALLCALGAVVFLAGFYFLCYRTPLNEVWLPTTMNNDEALYNRQYGHYLRLHHCQRRHQL